MTVTDFEFICQILRDRSGLVLTNDKAYLLESRLLPVARKWKLAGFDDLVKAIRMRPDETMIRDVVEAMTTNESFFFRDTKPFDQFKQLILPTLLKERAASKTIRIWSAACSSGQEAYSLAMILSEMSAQLSGWKIDIVGTDLSTEILSRAKEGVYSQFEVQRGLPITLLVKYFQQNGDRWQISQKIRSMVQYREFNLLQDPVSLGRFDVVFCRNVLIYFDQPTKAKVLNGIAKQMPNDGFLILGGAETVLGLTDRFQLVPGQRGIYCVANGDGKASPAVGVIPRPAVAPPAAPIKPAMVPPVGATLRKL
ncbi:MAG TPA: protein-glutamate O-methyltransferase CheR [Terriglobia bacterium]|nr:protein-glutamate O-methyltransferase CheR [Terriglobia bacterium]